VTLAISSAVRPNAEEPAPTSGSDDPGQPPIHEEPSRPVDPPQEVVVEILTHYCGECHITEVQAEAAAGLNYIDDSDLSIENDQLVPGSSEDSRIHTRMVAGEMPPPNFGFEAPGPTEIELVGTFIDDLDR
jgi:hypothetical protein